MDNKEILILADDGNIINAQEISRVDLTVSRSEVENAKKRIADIKANIDGELKEIEDLEKAIAFNEVIISLADERAKALAAAAEAEEKAEVVEETVEETVVETAEPIAE